MVHVPTSMTFETFDCVGDETDPGDTRQCVCFIIKIRKDITN